MYKKVENKETVATPKYRKVQLNNLKNYNIFVKSYFGQRLLNNILGEKGS
jgi:hypothetical protein